MLSLAVCLAAAGAAVSGCASGVPVRSAGVGDGGAGGGGGGAAWEAVFLPAGTAAAQVGSEPASRAEYSRLDGALSLREDGVLLATAQWPEPARPSVERVRRVFQERDARTALFFLPRRERARWGWEWGWRAGWR